MVAVMVRVEHELHRQVRDRRDLFGQSLVILVAGVLRIRDDQPVARHADERIEEWCGKKDQCAKDQSEQR